MTFLNHEQSLPPNSRNSSSRPLENRSSGQYSHELILSTLKNQAMARYPVLDANSQLFASKCQIYLPIEEELRAELERERHLIKQQQKK